MKSKLIPIITTVILITSYGADKAPKNEKQPANPPSAGKKAEPANDIVGEWEMVSFIVDTNDNLQIDEAERNNLKRPSVKDYMKLNRDGSGEFTVAKMPGRYEVRDPDSSGKRFLTWYDRSNSPHRIGTILKVSREELHIKEFGGHGLFVWKRL